MTLKSAAPPNAAAPATTPIGAATGTVINPKRIGTAVPPKANAAAPAPTVPTPIAPISVKKLIRFHEQPH